MTMVTIANTGLEVDQSIYDLVSEIAPDGISPEDFFTELAAIAKDLGPKNAELLAVRDKHYEQIDKYFAEGKDFDPKEYEAFLKSIGYIEEQKDPSFQVDTQNTDPEIADISGPELVCPADIPASGGAQYILNAANARWGSLYAALYGKPGNVNVIDESDGKDFGEGYNGKRGKAVIDYARNFLDESIPLAEASWSDVSKMVVNNESLIVTLKNGSEISLEDQGKFFGFMGEENNPSEIILSNNGLRVRIQIDTEAPDLDEYDPALATNVNEVGKHDPAHIKDIVVEGAITVIVDGEDSAVTVDAQDIVGVHRNWTGLNKGDLSVEMSGGRTRKLNEDIAYKKPNGEEATLHGRAMMMYRKVGLHMMTDAVTLNGEEIPQGFLDAMLCALGAKHNLDKPANDPLKNSKTGSIYVVQPKMHGSSEVAATIELFERVEKAIGLPDKTMKIGIMDEEETMSLNLHNALVEADGRSFFVNTGFLDRTASFLRSSLNAGPMQTKDGMNKAPWKDAYERNNVLVALGAGLQKVGKIGKGMYARNQHMKGLVDSKAEHPKAGANCAWVPSHHGAWLHTMHYHQVNVDEVQQGIIANPSKVERAEIVNLPFMETKLSGDKLEEVLDAYTQSILGYVSRWVTLGIGCSSVPDIENVGYMEDRATLRIGSLLLANWVNHGIISEEQLEASFKKMAVKVDEQNAKTAGYVNLADNFDGPSFKAATELVSAAGQVHGGYTEYVLHKYRKLVKEQARGASAGHTGGGQIKKILDGGPKTPGEPRDDEPKTGIGGV